MLNTRSGSPSFAGSWWGLDRVSTGNVFTPRIASLHLELDDPPSTLSPAPSMQEWRIRVRKNKNHSTDPLFTADLYEGGLFKERVVEGTSVSSMAPLILEGSWEADILADPSGKFVEAKLTSTNRSGNTYVDIGALEWIPVTVPSVQVSLGVKYNVLKSVAAQPLNLRWNILPNTSGLIAISKALTIRWNTQTLTFTNWGQSNLTFSNLSTPYSGLA